MDRRSFMASGSAAALAATLPSCTTPPAPGAAAAPTGDSADARLRAMLDRIFYGRLEDNPEGATGLGLDVGERAHLRGRLDDYSSAGRAKDLGRARADLAQLHTVDRTRLSPAAALDLEVVEYDLTRTLEGARIPYGSAGGRYSPYVISQLTGPYRGIPDFLDTTHPVKNAADADAYLSRLAQFDTALDASLARQREDAARGVFAPDYVLDTTLRQLRSLRDQPAAQTLLVTSLARRAREAGLGDAYASRAERIVAAEVFPALDRQIALVTELRGRATHDAGVWRLPEGEAYYAGALEAATTTSMGAEEIHQLGLSQVAELEARLDPILRAHGLTRGSAGQRLAELNKDPAQLYPNTDEGRAALLAHLNRQIAEITPKLPQAFATLPKAEVEVRRVPPLIQAGAPGGYYDSAPLDGSRPGIYYINLRDTFDRPKFGLATLTYHEAVPGHHLQISLAQESEEIPLIRRLGGYSAYSEGWALYSEQLADELGMYEGDPLGRAGMLQSFLFRATRLVVDTGLHAKRWSREQATDYFIRTTGIARGRSQGEIDRYTVWPGQATSYKVGHIVWDRLRSESKAKLGPRFDLRDFHQVLLQGAVPLTVLERLVERRTAERLRG
ncbi:MAG: protein of unknown function DUF885 [uncultured Sphingomonas sp.]|uniref:Tat (Twin-arginine translocation) pathway signal sequence domain protein n=1 Tax=uncultured Sphingomonas sp. TaxID=158754 RepID=A0A6J4T3G8_9SPHN|nr:DUF885 family protein [uncultured Sphingomonas sp.]CAA9512449.1 MAG: protein of unknown function DUF885 [uncultured Sphingomonas sp.]